MRRPIVIFSLLALLALATLAFSATATAQVPGGGWQAEYWANRDLAGSPAITTEVPTIAFNWGLSSPRGLPADNFSARFTRRVTFPGGPVRFFARSDDGIRLWVDDALLIDRWSDHPADETYAVSADLAPGSYTIRVEYYEHLDRAQLDLWWEVIAPERVGSWQATYWANEDLAGSPALTTEVPEINFDWGRTSPTAAVPRDRFSARFTRTVRLPAGDYRFFARADDGVRLWLDDWLLIDRWRVGPATLFTGDFQNVGAGEHTITVEYFERTGDAVIEVWWERVGVAVQGAGEQPWQGEYFANRDLRGSPAVTTRTPVIAFNWGTSAPFSSLPADNFSVRWRRTVTIPAGDYEFVAVADDGVRVYLDDWLVIDGWHQGAARTSRGIFQSVGAGEHTITVEYFEQTGLANINFRWYRR